MCPAKASNSLCSRGWPCTPDLVPPSAKWDHKCKPTQPTFSLLKSPLNCIASDFMIFYQQCCPPFPHTGPLSWGSSSPGRLEIYSASTLAWLAPVSLTCPLDFMFT